MKRFGAITCAVVLVVAACDAGSGTTVDPSGVSATSATVSPTPTGADTMGDSLGTPVPQILDHQLIGAWISEATLTLNEDGTYLLLAYGHEDRGDYRFGAPGNTLQLETSVGDLCEAGEFARLSVERFRGDGGTWLALSRLGEECESRDDIPLQYHGTGTSDGTIAGTWRVETVLEFRGDGTYSISSAVGVDHGTYTYEQFDGRMTLVTSEGTLCEAGSEASVQVNNIQAAGIAGAGIIFESEETCPARSRLDSAFHPVVRR